MSIGSAFVLAIATTLATGITNGLVHSANDLLHFAAGSPASKEKAAAVDPPPVTVDSATYTQSADDGFTFAFPQALTKSQVSQFNHLPVSWEDYQTHANTLGGAITGDAAVQIVLSGNAPETVVIAGIQIVPQCKDPLTGTLLESPPAAEDQTVQIGFNLDRAFPVAENYEDGRLFGDFFTDHTITLAQGQTQTLVVHAQTDQRYCKFILRLLVDAGGKQVTEPVANKGKPFAVTAVVPATSYKTLYAGGVISPAGNDSFVPVTARAFAKLVGES